MSTRSLSLIYCRPINTAKLAEPTLGSTHEGRSCVMLHMGTGVFAKQNALKSQRNCVQPISPGVECDLTGSMVGTDGHKDEG